MHALIFMQEAATHFVGGLLEEQRGFQIKAYPESIDMKNQMKKGR